MSQNIGGHRPDEQRAPLGVAALVLVDGLGADPQSDAEIDARERGDVQLCQSRSPAR